MIFSAGILDFAEKRALVVERIQDMDVKLEPINAIFSQEMLKDVEQCKNTKELILSLETKYDFKPEMLDDLFQAARVSHKFALYFSSVIAILPRIITKFKLPNNNSCCVYPVLI